MEPLWSPVVATGGNQRQIDRHSKPRKQATSVAAGCHRLRREVHGKEGVDGSSPSEGSLQKPRLRRRQSGTASVPPWTAGSASGVQRHRRWAGARWTDRAAVHDVDRRESAVFVRGMTANAKPVRPHRPSSLWRRWYRGLFAVGSALRLRNSHGLRRMRPPYPAVCLFRRAGIDSLTLLVVALIG
jgi:hypothetical protein